MLTVYCILMSYTNRYCSNDRIGQLFEMLLKLPIILAPNAKFVA